MTSFGIIWLLICFFCFFKKQNTWFFILIFSCVFQATAVINIDGKGISPLVITEIFFTLKYFKIFFNKLLINKQLCLLLIFILYSIPIVFISTNLFAGIEVFTASKGIDDQALNGGTTLFFSFSNLNQIFYLLLNFITLLILYNLRTTFSFKAIHNSVIFCILFVCLFGYCEFILKNSGFYTYLRDFIYNNEGYAQLNLTTTFGIYRLNATFIEASFAGAFLASSFWFCCCQRYFILTIICLIALILNLSGTGIISLFTGSIIYIIFTRNKLKNLTLLAVLFFAFFILLYNTSHFDLIYQMLSEKSTSQSGVVRYKGAEMGLQVLLDSYLLGAGIGSHRGGSFLFDILANLGILGALLFFMFIYYSISNFKRYSSNNFAFGMLLFSITLLVAQIIAIPDLSFPLFWFWVFVATIMNKELITQKIE